MSVRFSTKNRDDFILFGKVVAETLRSHDPNRQWVISLQGDTSSGKSLIPLAADWQRNPTVPRYSQGIQPEHFVHKMAAHHHPEHYKGMFESEEMSEMGSPQPDEEKIYFNDGLGQVNFREDPYAEQWKTKILNTMPNTKLIFLSNVWNWTKLRTKSNAEEETKRILIDMRISVTNADDKEGDFIRVINYTTGDKGLDKKIKAAFDQRLNPSAPSSPAPAAKKPRRKRRPANET